MALQDLTKRGIIRSGDYESTQSNVSRIGEELRHNGNRLGNSIADDNIRLAIISIRNRNMHNRIN